MKETAKEFNVSESFVIATAVHLAMGFNDQPRYYDVGKRVKRRGQTRRNLRTNVVAFKRLA